MCALRAHIKLSIFRNIFSGIEKAVITFSILKKIFPKTESLMCALKAHISKILCLFPHLTPQLLPQKSSLTPFPQLTRPIVASCHPWFPPLLTAPCPLLDRPTVSTFQHLNWPIVPAFPHLTWPALLPFSLLPTLNHAFGPPKKSDPCFQRWGLQNSPFQAYTSPVAFACSDHHHRLVLHRFKLFLRNLNLFSSKETGHFNHILSVRHKWCCLKPWAELLGFR